MTADPRRTEHYRELDAAHHLHPFSDMEALNRQGSRVMVRGEGIHVWDSDGSRDDYRHSYSSCLDWSRGTWFLYPSGD